MIARNNFPPGDDLFSGRRKRQAFPGRDKFEGFGKGKKPDNMDPAAWLSKVFGHMLEAKRGMAMRERFRDNLLVQLGSCVYGDIWEGQEDEETGPLCSSMSPELRTLWKNIGNNILQEVCDACSSLFSVVNFVVALCIFRLPLQCLETGA